MSPSPRMLGLPLLLLVAGCCTPITTSFVDVDIHGGPEGLQAAELHAGGQWRIQTSCPGPAPMADLALHEGQPVESIVDSQTYNELRLIYPNETLRFGFSPPVQGDGRLVVALDGQGREVTWNGQAVEIVRFARQASLEPVEQRETRPLTEVHETLPLRVEAGWNLGLDAGVTVIPNASRYERPYTADVHDRFDAVHAELVVRDPEGNVTFERSSAGLGTASVDTDALRAGLWSVSIAVDPAGLDPGEGTVETWITLRYTWP